MIYLINFLKTIFKSNISIKINLIIFLFLTLIAAVIESFSIAIIVPFIDAINAGNLEKMHPKVFEFYQLFDQIGYTEFIKVLILLIGSFFLIKNFFIILFGWWQTKFIAYIEFFLSKKLYDSYFSKNYRFFIDTNSSILIRNLTSEISVLIKGLMAFFTLFVEVFIVIAIFILLVVINPIMAFLLLFLLSGLGFIFLISTQGKIKKWSGERLDLSGKYIQFIMQSVGMIREIKIFNKENFFSGLHESEKNKNLNINKKFNYINVVPRPFLETFIVFCLLGYVYFIISKATPYSEILTILSVYALAAIRLFPSISKITINYQSFKFRIKSFELFYKEIEQLNKKEIQIKDSVIKNEIYFKNKIEIKDIDFSYDGKNKIFNKFNFTIKKGEIIGIVGDSGKGKSTLINLILGFLEPQNGKILVDDNNINTNLKSWYKIIGYVPQNIYLSDDTIKKNIAIGEEDEKIDDLKIINTIKKTKLYETINKLPKKIDTIIGERGAKISGGQIQRIGIARALYHDPDIIFLDEATSQLDYQTERKIMEDLKFIKGKKTLIIISHRETINEYCDKIIKI